MIDRKKKKSNQKSPEKSHARHWIENLHGEIEDGRFDEKRLNYPLQENFTAFVDEISCKIKTSFLYNIKKNCSTNQLNEFFPVLVSLLDNNFID